jgi:error-prone DNA polymerase
VSEFAARCFSQIEGFGEYGFPESHAASFALLVYVSAWIKHHYPAVFACALLNSQPMGFYAPAQIVRDARDHGVSVLPVDVNCSDWDCTLEPAADSHALRLGLRQVRGFAKTDAERLMKARGNGYPDPLALWRRSGLGGAALEVLANADAFRSMGLDRREVLWAVKGLPSAPLPLFAAAGEEEHDGEPAVALSRMKLGEHVIEDYRALQLSLKAHPMALLRQEMNALGYATSAGLAEIAQDRPARFAGIVLVRQRPGTASGVIFATLEDETGVANIIVWPKVFERHRRILMTARLLGVEGTLQREGLVTHIVAGRLIDLTAHLHTLTDGGEIDTPLAHADHVKHAGVDAREKAAARRVRSRQPTFPSRDFH